MGYVWFDYDVCGEWEKKWKMYRDVNKKVKEKRCIQKKKKKMFRHKNWSWHCTTKEKVVEKKKVKQHNWI